MVSMWPLSGGQAEGSGKPTLDEGVASVEKDHERRKVLKAESGGKRIGFQSVMKVKNVAENPREEGGFCSL